MYMSISLIDIHIYMIWNISKILFLKNLKSIKYIEIKKT